MGTTVVGKPFTTAPFALPVAGSGPVSDGPGAAGTGSPDGPGACDGRISLASASAALPSDEPVAAGSGVGGTVGRVVGGRRRGR